MFKHNKFKMPIYNSRKMIYLQYTRANNIILIIILDFSISFASLTEELQQADHKNEVKRPRRLKRHHIISRTSQIRYPCR